MEPLKDYIITPETMVFIPKFDANGHPLTVVMESRCTFDALASPTDLVDYSLRYYGSSLRGAGDGARAILGSITKYPVLICEKLDIFWFPSTSPKLSNCVWFALHHIRTYEAVGKYRTIVRLSNGSTIEIDISFNVFEKRIQRAYRLRYVLDERTKFSMLFAKEYRVRHHYRKVNNEVNYKNKSNDIE